MHAAAAEADGLASLAPAAARLLSGETSAGSRLRELVHSASLCQRTAPQAAAASRAFAPLPPVAYFLRAAGEAGPNGGSDAAAAVAWPAGLCRQALVRGVIVAHCRSGALVRLTNAWPPGVAPVAGQERSGARKLKPSTLALLHASHALPAGLLLPRSPALGGAPAFEEVMRRRAPTDATVTAVALSVHDGSIVDGADGGGGGRGGGDNGGGGGGSDGGGVRICISILGGDCEASGLRPLLGCSAAPPGFSTGSAPSPRFLEGRGACWLTLRERVEELPPRPLDALRAALDIPQHASALAPPPTRTHAAGAAAGGRRAFESCRREQNLLWAAEAVRRGVAHARAGRQAEALAAYGHALELDPSHVDALVARGACLINGGRLRDAIEALDKAVQLDPRDANAIRYRQAALDRLQPRRADAVGDGGASKQPSASAAQSHHGAASAAAAAHVAATPAALVAPPAPPTPAAPPAPPAAAARAVLLEQMVEKLQEERRARKAAKKERKRKSLKEHKEKRKEKRRRRSPEPGGGRRHEREAAQSAGAAGKDVSTDASSSEGEAAEPEGGDSAQGLLRRETEDRQ